jgi:hypothetical protein
MLIVTASEVSACPALNLPRLPLKPCSHCKKKKKKQKTLEEKKESLIELWDTIKYTRHT